MTDAILDDYEWLVSPDGRRWSASLADAPSSLVQRTRRLRRHLSPARTHLLLELTQLRERARSKFNAAELLYFTTRSLEQATDQWVAEYKAKRFPSSSPVADLCCGVGGDLFSLAHHHRTATGIDCDPICSLLASANCRALGLIDCTVELADVTALDMKRFAAWHIDPDRRPTGSRTTKLEFTEPSWEAIERLLIASPHAAIKAAPATDLEPAQANSVERQWIGSGRECKQQVIWCGELARHPGYHTAVVVHHQGPESDLLVGLPAEPIDVADSVNRFLCVPHATVSAAQLTGALARRHNLEAIDEQIDYLTSDKPIIDPLLSCFELQEHLPFDLKQVKGVLYQADIGPLEIKKRGVSLEPEEIRRKLKLKGSRQATLLIAPYAGSIHAFIGCRVHGGTGPTQCNSVRS